MSKLMVLLLVLAVSAGCAEDGGTSGGAAGEDVCASCAGVQKATADGKCESCGATADACTMCAGVQTATAEGNCPSCGMKVGGP